MNLSDQERASQFANQAHFYSKLGSEQLELAISAHKGNLGYRVVSNNFSDAKLNLTLAVELYCIAGSIRGISRPLASRIARQIDGIKYNMMVHLHRQEARASGMGRRQAMKLR